MEVWQNGNVYGYGDYHIHVQDYLAGGMDIDQVISLLDSDTQIMQKQPMILTGIRAR